MIEILEFYPIDGNLEKGNLTGTLRVKLPDLGLHILGVYVSKQKNFWFFQLPSGTGKDHRTGETVRFPFIVFECKEQQKKLFAAIQEKGRIFIEARLADRENPIVFPVKKEPVYFVPKTSKPTGRDKVEDVSEKSSEAKQKQPEAKLAPAPKVLSKLAKMEFVDLPKKPLARTKSKFAEVSANTKFK